MTCKACIHYDLCASIEGLVIRVLLAGDKADERCMAFKSKADFVEVVRCKDCKYLKEYSDEYKQNVEKADGDCYFKWMYSCDKQYAACKYNEFCSYGERK